MNRYWGDLHNHCGITYCYGSLKHALDRAKSHLDFCDGVPYFFPVVIQFLEASAVKVHHKSGFFISLRYIRPHGMSGDSAEIKMAFCTV